MSRSEHPYDILDVIRVIKGVWILLIVVPVTFAGIIGAWAYTRAQETPDPHRFWAAVNVPSDLAQTLNVNSQIITAAEEKGLARSEFSSSIAEMASDRGLPYRTIQMSLQIYSSVDGRSVLENALLKLSENVEKYSTDIDLTVLSVIEKRRTLERYFNVLAASDNTTQDVATTAAVASGLASIVSASRELDADVARFATLGSGPLEIVTPVSGPDILPNTRWIRFPVAAGFTGLLAVLFVAFTLDGIRHSTARRMKKA